ncbi:MAG TPA: GDSL-type esterase/lipase family protein [Rhodocyclaceae bacterium]
MGAWHRMLWTEGQRWLRRGLRLGCLACLPLGLAACSPSPPFSPLPTNARVLVLGDSLVSGYGLSVQRAWPALLSQTTGWQIENAGVSGNTSEQGLARLPDYLDVESPPAAVIVVLGGNDMLRKIPEAQTRANLATAIEKIRRVAAVPVLIAVPRPSLAGAVLQSLDDADLYAELAAESNVPLIESVFSDVLSESALKLDRLHPNDAGQQELARRIADAMRKLGLFAP